jgi:hypothetical protein
VCEGCEVRDDDDDDDGEWLCCHISDSWLEVLTWLGILIGIAVDWWWQVSVCSKPSRLFGLEFGAFIVQVL